MKKKLISIIVCLTLVLTGLAIIPLNISAATKEEIEQSINNGITWLVGQQNMDGSWGTYEQGAHTAFVLIKLQDRAYELGYDSPFDIDYPYYQNVVDGWEYLFSYATKITPLPIQNHGMNADDPDTNGNGYGICFNSNINFSWHPTYTTGIAMMALGASGSPDRLNEFGLDFDGDGTADTYLEICQETMDWMAFAQADFGLGAGGFGYGANDNSYDWADNSNSGYAVLGLAAAEAFGCTIPNWVKTELNLWIDYIQNDVTGDLDDGGSGYSQPDSWVNELKTGNLLFQMTFYGDDPSVQRFQDALDYIERHWQDANWDPGWGFGLSQAHYQAMYCLMKGFVYSGINMIDLDNNGVPENDWYEEFTTVLVVQQQTMGYWLYDNWGDEILSTVWALLTLEKITPPLIVYVDIKPGSCPNPLNRKDKGVIPVAICGTDEFDVSTIDPASIKLEGVSPIRWSYEDVATPFEGELCDCHDLNGDGFMDLALKFSTQGVVAALVIIPGIDVFTLTLTGNLKEEYGGTALQGQDCMIIVKSTQNSDTNELEFFQILLNRLMERFPILEYFID